MSLASELLREPPLLHGAGGYCFTLGRGALEWLERNVAAGSATLETGVGMSTLVFGAAGSDHDTVAPAPDEFERTRAEAEQRGIDLSRVTFHDGPSDERSEE